MKKIYPLVLLGSVFSLGILGCSELDGYGSGYSNPSRGYSPPPYYGDGYDDRSARRVERERRELERERDRLEDERERIERDRRSAPPAWAAPRQRPAERCPSGYSPSEQKCSVEERRRGCKDMRLPGGLGCVRR